MIKSELERMLKIIYAQNYREAHGKSPNCNYLGSVNRPDFAHINDGKMLGEDLVYGNIKVTSNTGFGSSGGH